MKNMLKGPALLYLSVGATLLYLAISLIIPPTLLAEIFNGVFIGVVGGVAIVFYPVVVRALGARKFDGVSQLAVGIVIMILAQTCQRVLSAYINATSIALRDHLLPAINFAAYLAILGGILHISAAGMVEDKWTYNRGTLAFAVVVGLAIAGLTIYVQHVGLPY